MIKRSVETPEAEVGTIGKRIKRARGAVGLSQQALAQAADVSMNGIARLEQDSIKDPHLSQLRKIAAALGVSVGELVGEEEQVLAGKADAPHPGRPDSSETIADTVHDLVIKQDRREAQALNRLHESRQPQPSYGHDDHKAMMYLLKLPDKRGAVEEAYIDLMRSHVNLERENARLKEENAQLREESARAHVND